MNVLIAFASTEGQTRRIAAAIADQARAAGHGVQVVDAARMHGSASPETFDAVIVAAPVHEDRHHDDIEAFVVAFRNVLAAKRTMFVSVSLAAAFAEGRARAEGYIAAFAQDTGWKPGRGIAVAGALHNEEYDYYQQQILEHVVLKDRNVDHPERDQEFTDWQALRGAVQAFLDERPP